MQFEIEGSKLNGRYYKFDAVMPAVGDYFQDGDTIVKVTKRKIVSYSKNVILTCKDAKEE